MRLVASLALVAMLLTGCSSSGLSGKYLTDPGGSYGWEFDGDTVYSLLGDGEAMGRGTYTVTDESVRVCMGSRCVDLERDGDCLLQEPGGRYCTEKGWADFQANFQPVPNAELAGLSCDDLLALQTSDAEAGNRMDAMVERIIRCGAFATPAP